MNKLFIIVVVSLFMAMTTGCAQEDVILSTQKKQLVSFLTSKHNPTLIPEEQLSVEGALPFYSTSGNVVYRYIPGAEEENPDRESKPEVTGRSIVTITYRAYLFNYTTIPTTLTANSLPFDSNDPEIEEEMYTKYGLTPGLWSFEPYVIQLGRDEILKGLRLALIGCREGDYVEAYMTYNMAYGSKYFGLVPRDTPVAYFFTVDNVE